MNFKGSIPASKSIMNRLLVCSSYGSGLNIKGDSSCDDVVKMKGALLDLTSGRPADCGDAGTVFRFLTFKASRNRGQHILTGTQRLMSRPQKAMLEILDQLGVKAELSRSELTMLSNGWNIPDQPVMVDRSISSQYISGLALNCWSLDRDITFKWEGEVISDGYWEMTLRILSDLGMEFETGKNSVTFFKGQTLSEKDYLAEPDYSSAFAVAAIAALDGEMIGEGFPEESLQPDSQFVEILKSMGANVDWKDEVLTVSKAETLRPVSVDLVNSPDLFPVLSVLCSFAHGDSKLFGVPHLIHKESDRMAKSKELLDKMGKSFSDMDGGLVIHGRHGVQYAQRFVFDTDHDHRMAFAAALAQKGGYEIDIKNPEVVKKSFPEFWDVVK